MSGAGKSYIGKQFAKAANFSFIDIDGAMEIEYGKPLQDILDTLGDQEFLKAQAEQILELAGLDTTVISPGGSVVYSEEAMEFLRKHTTIVYLESTLATIQARIKDTPRGIVGLATQTLEELYNSRVTLYEKWADITVKTETKTPTELCQEIATAIHKIRP